MVELMRGTALLLGLGLFAVGCDDAADGSSSSSSSTGSGAVVQCTMPTTVPCSDQVILDMNFKTTISDAAVSTTADGGVFTSNIDSSAGGIDITESYVYARFGDAGLEKVDISDEDSLDSMDWDIAFRRYVLRINSGFSGPSCVSAVRVPTKYGAFEDIAAAPPADELTYQTDEYFTPPDSCELIPDGSGLPGSPATALSTYWTYPGCVKMTDFPYIVRLANGKTVKLVVDHYYKAENQELCDTTEKVPTPSGAGDMQIRWAFVP